MFIRRELKVLPWVYKTDALRSVQFHTVSLCSRIQVFSFCTVPYSSVSFHRIAAVFAAIGVKCPQKAQNGLRPRGLQPASIQELEGAGGTGIEPAPCGFGAPIRRVGWCRTPAPEADLPHSLCHLLPPHVAACRRVSACVGGHWGTYGGTYWGTYGGSRCLRGRSSPCAKHPIRGRTHLT
jgi:hypothetical protein